MELGNLTHFGTGGGASRVDSIGKKLAVRETKKTKNGFFLVGARESIVNATISYIANYAMKLHHHLELAEITDDRSATLAHHLSPVVTLNPKTPATASHRDGDTEALAIVSDAFTASGAGVHHQSSSSGSVAIGPLTYQGSESQDLKKGHFDLGWNIVLERREFGSADDWLPVDEQPW